MTPEQIALVESSLAQARPVLGSVAADLYRRLFQLDPAAAALFRQDPAVQQEKFVRQLELIVESIGNLDEFLERTAALGLRHRSFGASPASYRHVGRAMLDAMASALGPDWTDEVEQAWTLAYNLIAESMMAGAATAAPSEAVG